MLRRQTTYSLSVGFLGLLLALWEIPQLLHSNLLVFAGLAVLAIGLECLPISLRQNLSSVVPVIPLSAIAVYGSAQSVWVVVVAALVSPLVLRDWNWITAVFNAGQYALSAGMMSFVFREMHQTSSDKMQGPLLLDLAMAAVVFLIFNHLFIHILKILGNQWMVSMALSALAVDAANLTLCLPFAFLVVAVSPVDAWLGPVVLIPIVVLAYMLRSHRRTRELQLIHQATIQLTSEFDVQTIADASASITKEMTLADVVVIFLLDRDGHTLIPKSVFPTEYAGLVPKEGLVDTDGGVIWSTIYEKRIVSVPDVRKDERVRVLDGQPSFLSMAIFPMHTHSSVTGAIVCYAKHPRAFSYVNDYMMVLANQVSVLFDNARLYAELEERTRRDAATGLFNYRFFYEELARSVDRSKREHVPVSVVIVDVDFFKKFNDTYGHLAGDAVLREVGRLLQRHCQDIGVAARYGGEEFALLLDIEPTEAYQVAETIRQEVMKMSVNFQGYHLQGITVSIGIAGCPKHSESDRDLLLKADSAMYWGAKQRGRNRTAMYSPEFDAQLFVDELTGLYTHHLMNIQVRETILSGVSTWGVICLDIQQFGQINNTFGFSVGDAVLRQTGATLRQSLRHTELACRYGGDELLVVLPDVSDSELEAVYDRLVSALSLHRYHVSENVVLSLHTHSTYRLFTEISDAAELFNHVAEVFTTMKRDVERTMA